MASLNFVPMGATGGRPYDNLTLFKNVPAKRFGLSTVSRKQRSEVLLPTPIIFCVDSSNGPKRINPMTHHEHLRQLPSVNELLLAANGLAEQEGHDRAVKALRIALNAARTLIKQGGLPPTHADLIAQARASLQSSMVNSQSSIINATGVIIHTNLGRAPLSTAAQAAMLAVAQDYSPLEFDMATGERGPRGAAAEQLLCELTGAEAALVVNNCAAATVLMLAALAHGQGVVISRGQLVEIGGGFRVPDIMAQSGARLIEVGTTNRVRREDYAAALQSDASAILRVHSSNFKMIGFVKEVPIDELVAVAQQASAVREKPVTVLDDLGSGALLDTGAFGLSREPMPQDSVRAGVDVTCFSGDKLLGGPQAGLLVGRREAIARCRTHPLARAFRADKFTLAALGATLLHYARGEAAREVPVIRMLALSQAEIAARAERMLLAAGEGLRARGLSASLAAGESTVGGGSLPGETLPTTLIALEGGPQDAGPDVVLAELRAKSVIARIKDGRVLLDLRTVLDDEALVGRLGEIGDL